MPRNFNTNKQMNKILQTKVTDKCKDMGLSEEYVKGITDKLGGTVADDSTDETAIETVANQIVEIARLSQGEATRWVNKNKQKTEPPKPEPPKPEPPKPEPPQQTVNVEEAVRKAMESYTSTFEQRVKQLEEQNANLLAEKSKAERTASINAAYAKHSIPEALREYVAVPETVEAKDIDGYVAGMAQKLVALKLPTLQSNITGKGGEVTKDSTDAIAKAMLPGMGKKIE